MYSYSQLIQMIQKCTESIEIEFSKKIDGRIDSAIKESEILHQLKEKLLIIDSSIEMEICDVKTRNWYDFAIQKIPFNLKITNGGTDNVFNKQSIFYSLTGNVCPNNLNFNQWIKIIQETRHKPKRDQWTEYHFLVIDKCSKRVIIKSILDIHTFKTNPCNIMQINWKNEFKNQTYKCEDFQTKIVEIFQTIQSSLIKEHQTKCEFIKTDFTSLFK